MRIIDAHTHIYDGPVKRDLLLSRLDESGLEGVQVISLSPASVPLATGSYSSQERLDNLMEWKSGSGRIYPYYWVDPTEKDATGQVEAAVERGVSGFKIAANHFYPSDERNLAILERIASYNKPVLFHSGIFWDARASSRYNRPVEFEALINIDKLRFTLAHVSWPWVDECLAVYGKFLNMYSRRPEASVEMFIDLTPGTPVIYREEALRKLFTIGYDVENNVIFGSDSSANDYNCAWTDSWLELDGRIMDDLGIAAEIRQKIYQDNFLRSMGMGDGKVSHKVQKVGEFS